jgi:hypothetical protein
LPLQGNGQIIRYLEVAEFYDSAQTSHKTEYNFSTDLVGYLDGFSPLSGPNVKQEWHNNVLIGKRVYEKINTNYRLLVKDTFFHTEFLDTNYYHGIKYIPISVANCTINVGHMQTYVFRSQWFLLDSSSRTQYAYNNGQTSITITTKNFYNDRFLLSKTRSWDSKGQNIENKIWYPQDYNDVSGYNINSLIAKKAIALPIKQESIVNGKITGGSITKYNLYTQPVEIYSYENALLENASIHNRNVIQSSNYNLKSSAWYSSNGSLSQMVNSGNEQVALLWDQYGLYPIAQIKNVDSNSIAYTSFEPSAIAKWTVSGSSSSDNSAVTGSKVYNLPGGSIIKSGLSAQTYIVSYWKKLSAGGTVSVNSTSSTAGKTANGWTYYEHKIVNPSSGLITVSGSGTIDELRLYPDKTEMITYTVEPLIGMTSQCDANNRIIKYQYDALNRLSLVRDEDNNIIKKICYNYKGQLVDCGFGTIAAWQPINSTCEQSSGLNTGNQLVTEKDMNPASPTYNQTRVTIIYNTTACFVCNTSTCAGNDKKCINGICETGAKFYTGLERLSSTQWKCYYHYVFSDSSTSETFEQLSTGPCFNPPH